MTAPVNGTSYIRSLHTFARSAVLRKFEQVLDSSKRLVEGQKTLQMTQAAALADIGSEEYRQGSLRLLDLENGLHFSTGSSVLLKIDGAEFPGTEGTLKEGQTLEAFGMENTSNTHVEANWHPASPEKR